MKLAVFLLMVFVCVPCFAVWPGSGIEVQQNLPAGYEPSGIVWHPHFNALFLVSDEGILSKMNADGTGVVNWNIGGDLEGVTIANPDSNYVYAVVEYPFELIRFNASRGGVSARASLAGTIPAVTNTNLGIEAVTFVPNGHHPYTNSSNGGLFYLGVQENGRIYVVDVNFATGTSTLMGNFTPVSGRGDISGLHFSRDTKTLYVLYDGSDRVREITANNTYITEYTAPGLNQEGITVLPGCPSSTSTVFIAEDSGRVMKYESFPISCPIIDNDGDGYAATVDCNDNNTNINPGRIEIIGNGLDDDCNSTTLDIERVVVEAETMPTIYGANVVRLSDSMAFYSNGYAQETRTFSGGVYNVTIYARADIVSGRVANMRVLIDGIIVGNYPVTSTTFVPITFQRTLTTGNHTIRVRFNNDYYVAGSPPRDVNLYVDKVLLER